MLEPYLGSMLPMMDGFVFVWIVVVFLALAFGLVNTLVMAAGNYRFSDYIKIGTPMILIMLIVTLIGVPLLFPF